MAWNAAGTATKMSKSVNRCHAVQICSYFSTARSRCLGYSRLGASSKSCMGGDCCRLHTVPFSRCLVQDGGNLLASLGKTGHPSFVVLAIDGHNKRRCKRLFERLKPSKLHICLRCMDSASQIVYTAGRAGGRSVGSIYRSLALHLSTVVG